MALIIISRRSVFALFLGTCAVLTAWPDNALALQVHAGPEGLFVHQMAHVFFTASMASLLYILIRHPLGHGRGWTYLKLSLLFFIIWNINALITHSLELIISENEIISGRLLPLYLVRPLTFETWVYYIGKFDHLLCVPAMFFLTIALKTFCKEAEHRAQDIEDIEDMEEADGG